MKNHRTPTPLRATEDLLQSAMRCTEDTVYSQGIRDQLQVMGVHLTRDSDAATVRHAIDETLKSPSANVLRHLSETTTHGVKNIEIHVDPVTRDFIEMRGCSVAGILMAYHLAQDVDLEAEDLDKPVSVEMDWKHSIRHLGLMIEIGPKIFWQPGRVQFLKGLPATFGNVVVGRRMSDVVAHPLLDRHGMTITHWDGYEMIVEHDGGSTPVLSQQGG